MSDLVHDTGEDFARYAVKHAVAVITLDNPPVNGFSFVLRSALGRALEKAAQDSAVKAVVLIGANGVFSGGADIRQLDTPEYWAYPRTIEIAQLIDGMNKPVIAAIEKLALGGGLELALGCHWRIALASSQVGQPEIKLGLFPGGGAIVRLPRLVGLERAITMMLGGEFVDGAQALQWGLVDKLVEQDLETESIGYALELARSHVPVRRARDLPVAAPDIAGTFAAARDRYVRASSGPAPAVILRCTEVAVTQGFDAGVKASDEGTATLMRSIESKALRYLFFAEREARKLVGLGDAKTAGSVEVAGRVVLASGELDGDLRSALQVGGYRILGCAPEDDESAGWIGLRATRGTRLVEVLCTVASEPQALSSLIRVLRRAGRVTVFSAWGAEPMASPLLRAFHACARAASPRLFNQALRAWGVESGPLLLQETAADGETSLDPLLLERCLAAMAQEGRAMLADGRALRASDLDLVMVVGHDFPAIRGGPLFHADSKGDSPKANR